MTYKIIVEFNREISEDMEVIGKDKPTAHDLARQLAKELQEVYNDGCIAGHFQVTQVIVGNINTEIKP